MKGAIILALVACSAAVQPRAHYERLDPKLEFPKIHGQYIVVLESIAEHSLGVQNHFAELKAVGGEVKYNYHISNDNDVAKDFLGYHIIVKDGDTAVLEYIKSRVGKEVKYIEQDSTVRASESCDTQHSATWGIVRTVNRDNSNDGEYTYNEEHTGEDVVAYIIDTGIATDNEDFEDRAIWGADFATNPSPGTDGNGHGTHVASTVMGKTYGLAKKALGVGVAVLSAEGSGSTAGVIAGIDWSVADAKKRGKRAVGNMSLGGGFSRALNDAVAAGYHAGFAMIVAAGNESNDACGVSPASEATAYTVMSTTNSDRMSGFSNYGDCCDIAAPGSDITAAWIGATTATRTISGTSMASPHVCGVAAKLLSIKDYSPQELFDEITRLATPNTITGIPSGPNLFLFKDCASGGPTPPPSPTPPPPPTPPTPPPTPKPTSTCDAVPASSRWFCGGRDYLTQASCEAAISAGADCCWSQEPITAIWCYDRMPFPPAGNVTVSSLRGANALTA